MAKDMLIGFGGEGTKKTLQYILVAIVITIVVYVLYQVYKASQTAGIATGDILGRQITELSTKVQPTRQLVCKQVAEDCKSAIYFAWFTKFAVLVKDADLVNALNRLVTADEASLTCQFFRQVAGTSLLSIVNDYGVFTSKNYIKPEILNALT